MSQTQPQTHDERVQVLEFRLGNERYCVEIGHIEEIVKKGEDDLTVVPNSPPHVSGITDLRGQTTTIVDPKRLLNVADGEGRGDQIIVFDEAAVDHDGVLGWSVDEVYQVSTFDTAEVDDSVEDASVKGVVNRDGGFLIWTDPDITPS